MEPNPYQPANSYSVRGSIASDLSMKLMGHVATAYHPSQPLVVEERTPLREIEETDKTTILANNQLGLEGTVASLMNLPNFPSDQPSFTDDISYLPGIARTYVIEPEGMALPQTYFTLQVASTSDDMLSGYNANRSLIAQTALNFVSRHFVGYLPDAAKDFITKTLKTARQNLKLADEERFHFILSEYSLAAVPDHELVVQTV
tara:strand:+ start:13844 stop:14452 length:609 start_codon:yes stop_codon:yes gene_type:complete